ncbi:MAG: hypothetical protein MK193_05620 [Lentisphaeria bacterium]|nr:hypothetical protein [Lentisphaeria bacterium]
MSIEATIDSMLNTETGMDIIIISTSIQKQKHYWQDRLEKGRGVIAKFNASVYVIYEDWQGGAGNGLGTLYAFHKAEKQAIDAGEISILKRMNAGASAAIYHTAGKGTRLAPLPGSEENNKPGVKLPEIVEIDGQPEVLTILESVIRQTSVYAISRVGRLSVFWGDQIFIPTESFLYEPVFDVDILTRMRPEPTREEWEAEGLSAYGLIVANEANEAKQIEKISYDTFISFKESGALDGSGGIGTSLGSFSVSARILDALLNEFASELISQKGSLDTDPHFWMPLTLDFTTYQKQLEAKGGETAFIQSHYKRMQDFATRFKETFNIQWFLGFVDVGQQSYWWDYGQLKYYFQYNMLILENSEEAAAMRHFYQVDKNRQISFDDSVTVDESSIVIGSFLHNTNLKNTLVIQSQLKNFNAINSIVCNSQNGVNQSIEDGILYNFDGLIESLQLGGNVTVSTELNTNWANFQSAVDGSNHQWDDRIMNNICSFAELYEINNKSKE